MTLDTFDVATYRAPGSISDRFIWAEDEIAFLEGPYGSGKTTACFFKLLTRAAQMPIARDGEKHYRALVLRDTYRRMEKTAIRTWHKWYGKDEGDWIGGQDRPSNHKLRLETRDAMLNFELEFAAVGEADIEDFFDGYELTDLFLNAVNLQVEDVLTYGFGRCGRYPAMKDLPPGAEFPYGVIGDLNAPVVDTWLYRRLYDQDGDPIAHYRQPGAHEPGAENIQNQVPGYYDRQYRINAHRPWWIRRFLDNLPGYRRDGKPVFPEFSDALHVARQALQPLPDLPLRIGLDPGLRNPAAVISQRRPDGQHRVLREFVPGRMGGRRFGRELFNILQTEFQGLRVGDCTADPSGATGADKEDDELTWIEKVSKQLKRPIIPAFTNALDTRLEAVRDHLTYLIDGREPALLLSPSCKVLRAGFNGNYRYLIRKDGGQNEREDDKPDKHHVSSHPMDGLQYDLCRALGPSGVHRGAKPVDNRGQPRQTTTRGKVGFDVWSVGQGNHAS